MARSRIVAASTTVTPGFGKKRPAPTQRDLRDALTAIVAGKKVPTPRTEAVGCSVPDLR